MKEKNIKDRLSFLCDQFDIFKPDEEAIRLKKLTDDGYDTNKKIVTTNDILIAIVSEKINDKNRVLKRVSISKTVFNDMVNSDPTDNKIYLQWMLNVFSRLLKSDNKNSIDSAIRFVSEDLPQAKFYLKLFEENKRKNKFLELCKTTCGIKELVDPTNINQYKTLSQLFDAVDPFIEREPSSVERLMDKFVNMGKAEIPFRDRRFTLFIPKTTEANVIFDKFANWCTAKEGNGMFKKYTNDNRKPNGKKSDIYIIINNNFFIGESKELYQIHFETGQIKDRKNNENVSIFESVISLSDGLSKFFHDELIGMAKSFKNGIENNKYLEFLTQFGFAESLFELFPDDIPSIKIMNKEIPKLPDISRFSSLDQFIIINSNLVNIHHSIGNLINLEMLVLANNNIKTLPKEIGYLKNLIFLNIVGNKLEDIPDEIKYLDKSNGGSLYRIAVKESEIGKENYLKLKKLLPQTKID